MRFLYVQDSELSGWAPPLNSFTNPARMERMTEAMHDFNVYVKGLSVLHAVVLPLRDGLTVMRYRSPRNGIDSSDRTAQGSA